MPDPDSLFPAAPGTSGQIVMTEDTVFTSAMRNKVISLGGHELTLNPLPEDKFGVFFLMGEGDVAGEIAASLGEGEAAMVLVSAGSYAWAQASVTSVAGKTGAVVLGLADISDLAATLAAKALGPLVFDPATTFANLSAVPAAGLPDGAIRVVRQEIAGGAPRFRFYWLATAGAAPAWCESSSAAIDAPGRLWLELPYAPRRGESNAAPTANDDQSKGYAAGSVWTDTALDVAYLCMDASTGAAVWRQVEVVKVIDLAAAGSNVAWNCRNGNSARLTLAGNWTLTNPTNVAAGRYSLKVKQDATGGRTLNFGGNYKFPAGTPTLHASANAETVFEFVSYGDGILHHTGIPRSLPSNLSPSERTQAAANLSVLPVRFVASEDYAAGVHALPVGSCFVHAVTPAASSGVIQLGVGSAVWVMNDTPGNFDITLEGDEEETLVVIPKGRVGFAWRGEESGGSGGYLLPAAPGQPVMNLQGVSSFAAAAWSGYLMVAVLGAEQSVTVDDRLPTGWTCEFLPVDNDIFIEVGDGSQINGQPTGESFTIAQGYSRARIVCYAPGLFAIENATLDP